MNRFETTKRSLTKTVTYRLFIFISQTSLIFAITKNVSQSLELATMTNLLATFLYFLHERFWNKIPWGRLA